MSTEPTRFLSAAVSLLLIQIRVVHVLIWSLAGIPNVYYFGQEGLHNILVIDLLGPSLEDLFDHCNRRFTIKTVVMVAKQMVSPFSTLGSSGKLNADLITQLVVPRSNHPREELDLP